MMMKVGIFVGHLFLALAHLNLTLLALAPLAFTLLAFAPHALILLAFAPLCSPLPHLPLPHLPLPCLPLKIRPGGLNVVHSRTLLYSLGIQTRDSHLCPSTLTIFDFPNFRCFPFLILELFFPANVYYNLLC